MNFLRPLVILYFVCDICFALVPNLDFQVNESISLLYQVLFEGYGDDGLREETPASLKERLSTDIKNSEFVESLANPKRKYNHEYMTQKFLKRWAESLEEYDRQFSSNMEILSARASELKDYAEKTFKKGQLDFSPVFAFYDSKRKSRDQIRVFICSTNRGSESFAKAYGNNIMLKFNWGKCSADMCEILEQICYVLFQNMDPNFKLSMKNYFLEHKSPNALPAYFLLADVLAYTIGKLWAHSRLPSPYDSSIQKAKNPKVEKISRSILKTVEEYLKDGKKIDRKFFDEFIRQVELHFPKAFEEYEIMLKRICLVVENGIDVPECKGIIKSEFEIDEIQDDIGSYTTIFIGNNLGAPALRTIQANLPHRDDDYLLVTKDQKTRKLYIIIKTNDLEKIKSAMKDIKNQPTIKIGYLKGL